jgi:hypothetical protein
MSCQTCEHYHYRAGIGRGLLGNSASTEPTCICDFAGVSWPRRSATVTKPRGIPCEYKAKGLVCKDCGQTPGRGKVGLVLSDKKCVCKECLAKEVER